MSDIESLQKIKNTIEQFNKQQQVDILKIFIENNINISENSNGTFINLTDIDKNVLIKLQNYINFINQQNDKLDDIEFEKLKIEKNFFDNKNKNDNTIISKTKSKNKSSEISLVN
jgi:hypothetical protein